MNSPEPYLILEVPNPDNSTLNQFPITEVSWSIPNVYTAPRDSFVTIDSLELVGTHLYIHGHIAASNEKAVPVDVLITETR